MVNGSPKKMRDRKNMVEKEKQEDSDNFCFSDSFHPNNALENLEKFYQTQTLCDVTLVAEGNELKAHRVVLASCSPYFASMFTGNLVESQKDVIELKNVSYLSLEKIVTFCYTSSLEMSSENVFELLTAADMLQFPAIKDSCSAFLITKLNPANCFELTNFADMHSCQNLKEFSKKFARENFRRVVQSEAFLEADFQQVNELLNSENLGINSEKDVFDAALAWIKNDAEKRLHLLPILLKLVRLPQLPPKVLGK